MRIWFNGEVLADPRQPAVGVIDHGLTVGDGVFETLKVVDGVPFALRRHLDRLERSAAGLGLAEPDQQVIRRGVTAVTGGLAYGRLRITLTAGPGPLGSARGDGPASVVIIAEEMHPSPASAAVVVVPWRRNEHSSVAGLKTTSYAENVVALDAARRSGASEALMANTAGMLCEGTGSNVFYVIDGEVRTPTLASGCLAGVTRELVLEWCPWIREVDEPLETLQEATEVFLTSSTRDVQPVHAIDGRALPVPGEVTNRVMEVWAARSAEELEG